MKPVRVLSLLLALSFFSVPAWGQGSAKVVKVRPGESVYKIKRGGTAQISLVIIVDHGYHINSNRPADKNLIPTALRMERVAGLTTTTVIYPKPKLKKFEFSRKPLSVFEGEAVLRLSARARPTVPVGALALKAKLTVQACNNEMCLRPQTIDVSIPLHVE